MVPNPRPTYTVIAKTAGVSEATVSRVLMAMRASTQTELNEFMKQLRILATERTEWLQPLHQVDLGLSQL